MEIVYRLAIAVYAVELIKYGKPRRKAIKHESQTLYIGHENRG